MTVFSSLAQAQREGFRWLEYSREYGLHVVEIDFATPRGRVRALAFARPEPGERME
jgi:hypothetical protein